MKKRYFVFGFLTIFFLTASVAFLFLIPQESTEPDELPAEKVEKEMAYADEAFAQFEVAYASYTGEMERFLNAFMDLTYNCNYEERHYYDGAEDFMTEECYGYYVPMEDPEAVEDTFFPYTSYLHDTDYYYHSITESRAECLARIRYSSSHSQSDLQESILLLSLIRVQGEWKIESIETLEV